MQAWGPLTCLYPGRGDEGTNKYTHRMRNHRTRCPREINRRKKSVLEGGRVRIRETHPQEDGSHPGPAWGQQTQNGQRPRHPRAQDLRELLVLRLMSPRVKNPELPRTQLTCRLSWAPAGEGPEIIPPLEPGTDRARQTFPRPGNGNSHDRQTLFPGKPRSRPLPGPKPPNRPPCLQPPCLGTKTNKQTKTQSYFNWSRTAQLSPEPKLEARTFTLS